MAEGVGQESVVLRYRNGQTLRCVLQSEFRPRHENELTVCTQDGQNLTVTLDEL